MKKALTAGIVLAGVMAVSGSAFAEVRSSVILDRSKLIAAKSQSNTQRPPEPPQDFDRKRPPMSRDKRPPMPPDGKLPPKEAHSRDKRPPMPPRSGDRRPPEFDNRQHQQGVQPRW